MPEKIAIIGAGAAGLVAAITAARRGANVTLFEQNATPAKKILASGNGRCNISNRHLSIDHYHGENPEFVSYALKRFGFSEMERFFRSIGLLLQVMPDGRAYPLSNEARAVLDLLVAQAKTLGVEIKTEQKITKIGNASGAFRIGGIPYAKLLIATGSPAAPQLGADRSGMDLAQELGHSLRPAYPALVGLHLQNPAHTWLTGVKCKAAITLLIDAKREREVTGDILFTRYGISGFGILDISLFASSALRQGREVSLSLDLLPGWDRNALTARLASLAKALPGYPLATLLEGLLPFKVILPLLQAARISPDIPANMLTPKMIRSIVYAIRHWRFPVTDTHGYRHAEVSGGGIDTAEVDPRTLESKRIKNLFFAGEILDIVGDRGGYNLHFAWASGYLAGLGMTKGR